MMSKMIGIGQMMCHEVGRLCWGKISVRPAKRLEGVKASKRASRALIMTLPPR